MALVGAANVAIGLFPGVAIEIAEVAGPWVDRGLVQTGRMASVELGVLLLLIARKRAQGSQSTWRLAVLLTALAALVALAHGHLTLTTVGSAVACASLIATRSSYRLRRPGRRYSEWWIVVAFTAAMVLYASVRFAQVDASLQDATLDQRVSLVIRTALFLPGGLDRSSPSYEALAIALRVGMVIAVIGAVITLRLRQPAVISDADATLAFVRTDGTASTAPLLALPDNQLLTLCSGAALAAVGVRSGTAVCLGGPVAERGREAEALEKFTAYCEQAGWVPALVEAFIDVADFSTAGRRRSNVRHSVSRACRDGVSVLRMPTPPDQRSGPCSWARSAPSGC